MNARELRMTPEQFLREQKRQKAAKKARAARAKAKASGPDRRAKKRASKKEQRTAVRAACVEREGGRCAIPGCCQTILHLDHFWGRAREESVESCWMLCADHDREKTLYRPSRIAWLRVFGLHAARHSYAEQFEKVNKALALELAQHPEAP